MVVERLAGQSYADFLHETVFEPLGMASTFVSDESVEYPSNTAQPYDQNNRLYDYTLYTYGAGGIYTTLHDYVKWDRALYMDAIVQQSTLKLAFRDYTGGQNNFGYGWMVSKHRRWKSLRHGGFGGVR